MSDLDYLSLIFDNTKSINVFLQLNFYMFILLFIIIFGYWFFSRFIR